MKEGPPNGSDVRATLQLNFIVSMMFSLPVTVVGLQMCLLSTNLQFISTSFTFAMFCSWVAQIISRNIQSCSKPATQITLGLMIGLVSSFFLIDFKYTNTTLEKLEDEASCTRNLLIGLSMSAFGYTLSSVGVEEQIKNLMPRR